MIGLLSEVAFTCAQRLVQQALAADASISVPVLRQIPSAAIFIDLT
jgi:hypothetical protein